MALQLGAEMGNRQDADWFPFLFESALQSGDIGTHEARLRVEAWRKGADGAPGEIANSPLWREASSLFRDVAARAGGDEVLSLAVPQLGDVATLAHLPGLTIATNDRGPVWVGEEFNRTVEWLRGNAEPVTDGALSLTRVHLQGGLSGRHISGLPLGQAIRIPVTMEVWGFESYKVVLLSDFTGSVLYALPEAEIILDVRAERLAAKDAADVDVAIEVGEDLNAEIEEDDPDLFVDPADARAIMQIAGSDIAVEEPEADLEEALPELISPFPGGVFSLEYGAPVWILHLDGGNTLRLCGEPKKTLERARRLTVDLVDAEGGIEKADFPKLKAALEFIQDAIEDSMAKPYSLEMANA